MSKLFQKTLLITILLFGIIAISTSVLSGWTLYSHLTDEYRSKGIAIATSIADSSVEILLNRDASTIQAIIDQFLDIDGISYVFVTNAQERQNSIELHSPSLHSYSGRQYDTMVI